jgi:SSS family transporter
VNVGPVDLALLVAYLAAMIAFGVWIGRVAKSAGDYMVGGRDFPWWLILASIVATETSTVTFLSIPGFAFGRDLTWLQIALGFLAGRAAVAWLLLPRYFQGTFYTSYEVLQKRFGGAARSVSSALFILTRCLADGLRLFLSSIVLQEMTGIPLAWAVVAMGMTTIVYAYLGGMRSVLWTDLAQFVTYLAGAIVAFVLILDRLPGGWGQLLSIGAEAGKLRIFDFGLDWSEPYAFWAGIVGGIFVTLGSHGVDQLMVQRYFCARDLGEARKALVGGGFVILAQFALFLLIGVGLFAFYQLNPPAAAFDTTDRVFARFILDEMPIGVVGLLLGGIFSAALSGSLNSCATAFVNDLYRPWAGPRATPERELRLTRRLTAVFGGAQIAVGIGGQWLRTSVVSAVLGIAAFTTGIVLGVFFLGMWAPRVGARAAVAALVLGFATMTTIYFTTSLAWPWYALVGSVATFGWGLAASAVWPARPGSAAAPP